jgi:hypothetical protein
MLSNSVCKSAKRTNHNRNPECTCPEDAPHLSTCVHFDSPYLLQLKPADLPTFIRLLCRTVNVIAVATRHAFAAKTLHHPGLELSRGVHPPRRLCWVNRSSAQNGRQNCLRQILLRSGSPRIPMTPRRAVC